MMGEKKLKPSCAAFVRRFGETHKFGDGETLEA